ncbi:MAG: hypothetical protein ABIN67_23765 [Ferruginibacter sp.]
MAAAFLSMVVIDHYFPIYGRAGLMFVDSVALLIHYTFLGAFIYRIVNSQKRSLLLLGLLVVLFPTILFFSVNHDISKLPSNGVAIANFGLVVFCCFYYFHLFNSKLTKNLLKDPAFWIITGIFCCMGATVPMLAITQYLIENTSRSVLSGLRVYVPFLYGVMHLFFIKAYLCTAKLSKA